MSEYQTGEIQQVLPTQCNVDTLAKTFEQTGVYTMGALGRRLQTLMGNVAEDEAREAVGDSLRWGDKYLTVQFAQEDILIESARTPQREPLCRSSNLIDRTSRAFRITDAAHSLVENNQLVTVAPGIDVARAASLLDTSHMTLDWVSSNRLSPALRYTVQDIAALVDPHVQERMVQRLSEDKGERYKLAQALQTRLTIDRNVRETAKTMGLTEQSFDTPEKVTEILNTLGIPVLSAYATVRNKNLDTADDDLKQRDHKDGIDYEATLVSAYTMTVRNAILAGRRSLGLEK